MRISRRSALALVFGLLADPPVKAVPAQARSFTAGPHNYRQRLGGLRAGDELQLEPGVYREGLGLEDLAGTAEHPIVISGPADRSARFLARPRHNTVELRRVAHLVLRNLTLDGGNMPGIDGVKAQAVTHHVTLENLAILDFASHQQSVGISTKAPAWNWIIRDSLVRRAGTGLYLGNSDGSAPFVHGLIERNLVLETIGYGLEIKHQAPRAGTPGMPTVAGTTVLRHNIISKAHQPTSGFQGPRPNLLVGHLPLQGPGEDDRYEIYANLLYQNLVGEPLFQGEGNISLHDNLLVNHRGDAVWIQPHHDRPREVAIFRNTVVAWGTGIAVTGGHPGFGQRVAQNAVFARVPIVGGEHYDNFAADYDTADAHLRAPFRDWPGLDLRPRPGHLLGAAGQVAGPPGVDADHDFAGTPRRDAYRGAYAGPDTPREGPQPFPPAL